MSDNPHLKTSVDEIDSRYRLTHIVSQRAKALQEGCEPLVLKEGRKPVQLAYEELMAGKLQWVNTPDHLTEGDLEKPQTSAADIDETLNLTGKDLLSKETMKKVDETV